MFKRFATAATVFVLAALGAACSSGSHSDSGDEQDVHAKTCGGIAGIQCPSGQVCQLSSNMPDATGHCVKGPGPGEEGGMCGGIAGIQCKTGLRCDFGDDDSSGPPPGALGMPVHTQGGPPPGALGVPIIADQSGTCVADDSACAPINTLECASGYFPTEQGCASPRIAGGPTYARCAKSSGPPPGTMGLPLHN